MEAFKDYAYYYDMFYGDKNYCQEAQTIQRLLERFSSGDEMKLLNIGCGTGRHDIELSKLGYHVTGIDCSEQMVEIARKNYGGQTMLNLSWEMRVTTVQIPNMMQRCPCSML